MELWHTYMPILRMFSNEAYRQNFCNEGLAVTSSYFFEPSDEGLFVVLKNMKAPYHYHFWLKFIYIIFVFESKLEIFNPHTLPPDVRVLVQLWRITFWATGSFRQLQFFDCSKYDTSLKYYNISGKFCHYFAQNFPYYL